jgi:hypothetical protein
MQNRTLASSLAQAQAALAGVESERAAAEAEVRRLAAAHGEADNAAREASRELATV